MRIIISESQVKELSNSKSSSEDEGKMVKLKTSNCKNEYFYSLKNGYIRDSNYEKYDEAGSEIDKEHSKDSIILNDKVIAIKDKYSSTYVFRDLKNGKLCSDDIIFDYVVFEKGKEKFKELYIKEFGDVNVDDIDEYLSDVDFNYCEIHIRNKSDGIIFEFIIDIDGFEDDLHVYVTCDEIVNLFF